MATVGINSCSAIFSPLTETCLLPNRSAVTSSRTGNTVKGRKTVVAADYDQRKRKINKLISSSVLPPPPTCFGGRKRNRYKKGGNVFMREAWANAPPVKWVY